MYCPQCGQQQLSEEMRFCSRCGFALSGVMDLVATGGGITSQAPKKREKTSAIKGAKLGTWIIIASLLYSLVVGLLTAAEEDFAILFLVSVLVFLIGFVRILYAVFVEDRRERNEIEAQNTLALMSAQVANNVRKQLGQPAVLPVETFARPTRATSEVVQPPSVTEHTTRFLDDEADKQRRRN